jgi:chromosomal replication initiation ATPase DnaA
MTKPFIPGDVIRFAAQTQRLSVSEVRKRPSRNLRALRARWIAIQVLRERGISFCRIGQLLNRDHSTVLYWYHRTGSPILDDPSCRATLERARREFLR